MTYELSAGIAERLHRAESDDEQLFTTPHTLQVLSVKPVGVNGQQDRHRVILSDGVFFVQAMLATQLNNMVADQTITKHTVIVTEKISCNYVQGKRLLILMSVRILGQVEDKIGEPENLLEKEKEKRENGEADSTPGSAMTTPAVKKEASRAPPQQQPAQRQQAQNKSGNRTNLHPIEALSPYANNWTIKALVTQKSDIRTWSNTRGEGKLFNFTLADESGEIRVTAFNQQAEDLFDRLQEKKVYYVKGGKISLAKKKFSNVQNEYEMTLERNSEVEECTDTTNVPVLKYNFIPLGDLANLAPDSICDVIAVVKEMGAVEDLTSNKTGRQYKKRELTLVDKSGFSTRFTLWGKQAETFEPETENTIVAVKGAKVGDFGGRNLGSIGTTQVDQNPDLPESFALRGWYDAQGSEQSFQAHTNASGGKAGSGGQGFNRNTMLTMEQVRELTVPDDENNSGIYFSNRGTVAHIKTDNIAYPACSTQGCNKKVVEDSGSWRCEKCQKTYDSPQWRFILAMAVADHTGQDWYQGFNEVGEAIFGRTGNEVMAIKDEDEAEYAKLLQRSLGQTFNFVCRARTDTFNDQVRVRKGVVRVNKLDFVEEAKHLIELLDSPWGQS
ncbi:60S acidic ribosomal protein P1 [Marasmius crinis-equi]|uniref:Replication protein A subunit n=1 Tax=Marasmius crinis-equi TaxID=585013 RepID=A0ABR3FR56_9AGAR